MMEITHSILTQALKEVWAVEEAERYAAIEIERQAVDKLLRQWKAELAPRKRKARPPRKQIILAVRTANLTLEDRTTLEALARIRCLGQFTAICLKRGLQALREV